MCIHPPFLAVFLQDFRLLVERQAKEWDEIFTLEILKEFMQQGDGNERRRVVRGLANFLYRRKQISEPIPRKSRPNLSEIFEDYLYYCTTTRYDTEKTVHHIRRILEAFDHYLKRHNLSLDEIAKALKGGAEFKVEKSSGILSRLFGYIGGIFVFAGLAMLLAGNGNGSIAEAPCWRVLMTVRNAELGLWLK